MRAATAVLAVLLPLGLPAVAQGQGLLTPEPAAPAPAPAPPPAAAPPPVAGVLEIRAERVGRG
ncbi:MAG: dihydrolipoamide acetyltransferase, partial [Actinomycetota bacterium]|nr:dihydrolipoamide acetyltransferase [Actinomycetota bacterium]